MMSSMVKRTPSISDRNEQRVSHLILHAKLEDERIELAVNVAANHDAFHIRKIIKHICRYIAIYSTNINPNR